MTAMLWFIVVGLLLVAMALADSLLRRLPLTTAMLYLAGGVLLGPLALGLIALDPVRHAPLLERVAEIVVIVSLFAAGLKLRAPLTERRWVVPVALAFGSMALTVGLITAAGWALLGLPLGAAVLLGAVLAPTDPVLASDVQVDEPADRDRLRFSLTGEAGLNDGTAFPFVMLGLGLLGLHELGAGGWRWWAVDVVWAIAAGIAVGTILGTAVGRLVIHLRQEHREALGLDDFLALGLITLSYGTALLVHAYGFLAVFAAGLAVRRIERRHTGEEEPPPAVKAASDSADADDQATDPDTAPAYMAQAVLGFSEQLERIGTVGVVLLVGGMLLPDRLASPVLWFVPLLFLVIRPLAVAPVLLGSGLTRLQRGLLAWFGIRGIGSIYYLSFAVARGVPEPEARVLMNITLWVVAASILVHGLSVRPLIRHYTDRHPPSPG
ncbi:MAG TPA: cation:proton antiporter [Longimicrobiales bacterium]|nr:cation:proton antiporter [Longimicrobiales bacterium]